MRDILHSRPLRLLFAANFVSMIGSGMNSAAVTWYILQATHSEQILGVLVVAQAIPSLLLMPFSGVIIDREDRRRLVMTLDGARGLLILTVAILSLRGSVQVWQLFSMSILVSTGFWMFWPTITALLQELTPEAQFAESNALLLSGFQAGWLVAGAFVGFVYARIGVGGILLFDASTYLFSILCYWGLRKGRHTVMHTSVHAHHQPVARFFHEMRDGLAFVKQRISLGLLGITWALFVGAMMVNGVVTAPVSDRILHAGAIGYGWLNAGWGIGAFLSTFVAAKLARRLGWKRLIPASMFLMGLMFFLVPYSAVIGVGTAIYFAAGASRGIGGITLSTSIMELAPKHFMGRVQTLFSIFAILVQVTMAPLIGRIAHRNGLTLALTFITGLYMLAVIASLIAARAADRPSPGTALAAADSQ
jgi:MFS family permease